MAGSTFQTNPFDLHKLLDECHHGLIQLPDFQRSWVWDEDRIRSLIASVSRAFPVGALMTLDTGGPVNFKPRPVEGAPEAAKQVVPQSLLLDGQQRMTSLYQVSLRSKVVDKGVNALLMKEGAQDFRSGQEFDHAVFFGENVDIHHIFPQDWCKKRGIKPNDYDSIINKTPLAYRTNRIIGGVAPSEYLSRLEKGNQTTPAIDPARLDGYLRTHLIDPDLLRKDAFEAFMEDRQKQLLVLIERATGKASYQGTVAEEGEDAESDDDAIESGLLIAAG